MRLSAHNNVAIRNRSVGRVIEQITRKVDPVAVQDIFKRLIEATAIPFMEYRSALRSELARLRPKIVVVGNPNILEGRVAISEARAAGVPVVAMQHGSVMKNETFRGSSDSGLLMTYLKSMLTSAHPAFRVARPWMSAPFRLPTGAHSASWHSR